MISGEIKYVLSDSLAYCVTFTLHSVKWWSRSKVDREVDASDFFKEAIWITAIESNVQNSYLCATIWVFALTHKTHIQTCQVVEVDWWDSSVYGSGVFENANQQTNHDSDLPVLLFYPTTCRGFIYTYWCMYYNYIDCFHSNARIAYATIATRFSGMDFRSKIESNRTWYIHSMSVGSIWTFQCTRQRHEYGQRAYKLSRIKPNTMFGNSFFDLWFAGSCDVFSHWHTHTLIQKPHEHWTCLDICLTSHLGTSEQQQPQ